jgi:hypothetical protein
MLLRKRKLPLPEESLVEWEAELANMSLREWPIFVYRSHTAAR